jgi:hypothetical protein
MEHWFIGIPWSDVEQRARSGASSSRACPY